ncbi:hypothetical protein PUR23_19615 [Methylorubrum populi]|uniref:hypothetical protein n=1 Tax=Methylorubrum populi TaxID=223967 RepID=UPI0031F78C94
MMKRLALVLVALPGLRAPALAQKAVPPEIRADGDIWLGNAARLGRGEAGKAPITPDTLQIPGSRSTGPVEGMSAGNFVRPEDYALPGDASDDLAFQRAANTGRTVVGMPGKTYSFCRGVAGKKFNLYGSTIQAHPNSYCRYNSGPDPDGRDNVANLERFSFLYNPNWKASTRTDRGIEVFGGTFIGYNINPDGTDFPHGGFHAIKARMAWDVAVRDVTCRGVGDCTAFQAVDGGLVENSRSIDLANVGFDNWEEPQNTTIQNNFASCLRRLNGGDAGVMFTAGYTNPDPGKVGRNLLSRNNRISGTCTVGVNVNILAPNSRLENVVSDGDQYDIAGVGPGTSIYGLPAAAPAGIIFTGDIRGGAIRNSQIFNCNGGGAVTLSSDAGEPGANGGTGTPSNILIDSPRAMNCSTSAANVAPFQILGENNRLTNAVLRGGTYKYAVWTNSATAEISGEFDPGTDGTVLAQGGPNRGSITTSGTGRTCSATDAVTSSCTSRVFATSDGSGAAAQLTTDGKAPSLTNVPRISNGATANVTVRLTAFQGSTGSRATYEARSADFARGTSPDQTYTGGASTPFTLMSYIGGGNPQNWPLPTITGDTTYGGIRVMTPAVPGVRATAVITIEETR